MSDNLASGYEPPSLRAIGSLAELTLNGGHGGGGCHLPRIQKNIAWAKDDIFWFLKDCVSTPPPTNGS